jgi:hypothetical protein
MKRISQCFEAKQWVAPAILLGAFFLIGISVSGDYGIAWDEPVQRQYGCDVYNYVVSSDQSLLLNRHRYYGPVFEVLLVSLEKALGLGDTRSIYLMRHLVNFLSLWAGACFLYLLAKRIFGSWRMGLVAAAMLAISPRIFAHGFYNTKDIPFLAAFVAGAYTLIRYLDAGTIRSAMVHGLVCAVLVDIRIAGVFLVALTAAFAGYDLVRARSPKRPSTRPSARPSARPLALRKPARPVLALGAFAVSWAGVTVLLWPTLWRDPLANFVRVLEGMRNFPWEATALYLGRYVWSTALPWHYTPVWIAVSTPVAYVALFLVGLVVSARVLAGRTRGPVQRRRDLGLVLAWFFLPLVYSIASRAVLYDEWRHSFFVYPAMLMIGLVGLSRLWRLVIGRWRGRLRTVLAAALAAAVAANMFEVAAFMVRYHPHQNVYFNALAGGPRGAHGKFELDYWGLSYRQGLEFVLESDAAARIPVHAATAAGRYNADILKPADRMRIVFVEDVENAKYHVTNFRWDRERFAPEAEAYTVRIDGAPIMAVYRR